ncbi:hypothetical protein MPLB_660017 [Mesorhizobium sp. ORS 3324]|nr:hypothetical protein MPLB_660017 [Mesorhizobium sp. ORS 3324]
MSVCGFKKQAARRSPHAGCGLSLTEGCAEVKAMGLSLGSCNIRGSHGRLMPQHMSARAGASRGAKARARQQRRAEPCCRQGRTAATPPLSTEAENRWNKAL